MLGKLRLPITGPAAVSVRLCTCRVRGDTVVDLPEGDTRAVRLDDVFNCGSGSARL